MKKKDHSQKDFPNLLIPRETMYSVCLPFRWRPGPGLLFPRINRKVRLTTSSYIGMNIYICIYQSINIIQM